LSNLAVETKAQDAVNSMMAEIDALGVQARDALDKVIGDQDAKIETLMETFSVKLGDAQSLLMERLSQVDKRVARLADTHDAKIEDYSSRVTSSVLEEVVNLSKCFEQTLSTTLNSVTPEDLPELSRATMTNWRVAVRVPMVCCWSTLQDLRKPRRRRLETTYWPLGPCWRRRKGRQEIAIWSLRHRQLHSSLCDKSLKTSPEITPRSLRHTRH
jgi:hypothetical protein